MGTVIEIVKRSNGIYIIKLSNGDNIKTTVPFIRLYNIKIGLVLPDNFDIYGTDKSKSIEFATQKTVYLLSRRDYTSFEIIKKLSELGYPNYISNSVVEKLKSLNFINDNQCIQNHINLKQKKYGKKHIEQDLIKKGIDKSLIKENLSESFDTDAELKYAIKHAINYISKKSTKDKSKLYSNTIAMLARRGYSYDVAKEAYLLASNSEDTDSL